MKLRKIANNQTELWLKDVTILVSYETPVAYIDGLTGKAYKTSKKWSATTSRHINSWLNGVDAIEVEQSVLDNLLNVEK